MPASGTAALSIPPPMEPDVKRSMLVLATTVLAAAFVPARADEGMWTFNDFPADKVTRSGPSVLACARVYHNLNI